MYGIVLLLFVPKTFRRLFHRCFGTIVVYTLTTFTFGIRLERTNYVSCII